MSKSRRRATKPVMKKPSKPPKQPQEKPAAKAGAGGEPPDRDYYRDVWGFDPVADAQDRGDGWRRLEAWFPLDHDLPLQAAGVAIGARVDWRDDEVRNRIVFRRENTEVTVDCVHTVVFDGPAREFLSKDNPEIENIIRDAGIGASPVKLPAVEHFAALKSFVEGIAEMGVLQLSLAHGINGELLHQVRRAVKRIAPSVWDAKIIDRIAKIANEKGSKKLVHFFRMYASLDKLQNRLFKNPALIACVREFLPGVPWTQLQREWQARRAIQHNIKASEGRSWNEEDLWEVPPVEVYPRGPLCRVPFPEHLFSRDPDFNSPAVARARLEQFFRRYTLEGKVLAGVYKYDIQKLGEAINKNPSSYFERELDDRKKSALRQSGLMAASHPLAPPDVVAFLARSPWDDVRAEVAKRPDLTPEIRALLARDASPDVKWALVRAKEPEIVLYISNNSPDLNLISNPSTHPDVLWGFTSHWDFRLRLALAVRDSAGTDLLEVLAQDKQPSVRAIAQARLDRGEKNPSFIPGQILSPGEILWLLVAHPGKSYLFISLGYEDMSPEYALWLYNLVESWPSPFELAREVGEEHVWTYIFLDFNWGGYVYEYDRDPIPIKYYLPLDGLREISCGKLPCILLECDVRPY